MLFSEPYRVRIVRYDSDGEIKSKDFFDGGIAPFPTNFPKVCFLSSGIVIVANDKNSKNTATNLYVDAYSAELKTLYEKQIFKTGENSPQAHFNICSSGQNRFVIAVAADTGDLLVYECDENAKILQTFELPEAVSGSEAYVEYLDGRIFAAFSTKLKGNQREGKIKFLALKPCK